MFLPHVRAGYYNGNRKTAISEKQIIKKKIPKA